MVHKISREGLIDLWQLNAVHVQCATANTTPLPVMVMCVSIVRVASIVRRVSCGFFSVDYS